MGSEETVIIVPGNEEPQTDPNAVPEAITNAAVEAGSAATVSTEAAGTSVEAAEISTESATVASESATVALTSAEKTERTLNDLYDVLDKLPERLAQSMGQTQQPTVPVPQEEVEQPPKQKVTPDVKPDKDHPYFRRRGAKK